MSAPLPRRLTVAAERSTRLDGLARVLQPASDVAWAQPGLRQLLRGRPLGHAAHPLLTDLPIGLWTSSAVLDLVGPRGAGAAADRLLGLGILSAAPAALTGLVDWHEATPPVRRVGALHASLNSVALAMYTTSWVLRRRDRRAAGITVGLAAGAVLAASGYLGGHMVLVQRSPRDDSRSDPDRGGGR
jgi:uncharacterized membrane protein